MWIWLLGQCEGGSVPGIIAKAKACGISWLAIKGGDSDANGQVTPKLVDELHAGGLKVYSWNYCIPGTATRQIVQVRAMQAYGVDGHYLDAEIEWEQRGDRRMEAEVFCRALRSAVGDDFFLAHAPWPIASAHPTFPWVEFGGITQVQSDQLYWTMQGGDADHFMTRADLEWGGLAKKPGAVSRRCPIGSAFDGDSAKGGQACKATDVAKFLDRYQGRPSLSLWSYQHLSPEVWKLLEKRAPTAPYATPIATPDVPIQVEEPSLQDQ